MRTADETFVVWSHFTQFQVSDAMVDFCWMKFNKINRNGSAATVKANGYGKTRKWKSRRIQCSCVFWVVVMVVIDRKRMLGHIEKTNCIQTIHVWIEWIFFSLNTLISRLWWCYCCWCFFCITSREFDFFFSNTDLRTVLQFTFYSHQMHTNAHR